MVPGSPQGPGEELQVSAHMDWKAVASAMTARAAYRRYHGVYRASFAREVWLAVLFLLLAWGLFSVEVNIDLAQLFPDEDVGDLFPDGDVGGPGPGGVGSADAPSTPSPSVDRNEKDNAENGLRVVFIWVYDTPNERLLALLTFLLYILVAFFLIKYQKLLQLRLASWTTFVMCALMALFAVQAISKSGEESYSDKRLFARAQLMLIWEFVMILLLIIGWFRKKMLPWLHHSGRVFCLGVERRELYLGAKEGLEIWKRHPRLLESLEEELSAQTMYTFSATYSNGFDFLMHAVGMRSTCTSQYAGCLDDAGVPHGVGAWFDSDKHGEFVMGYFMHGTPVAPFRARGNQDSTFIAYRIAILSVREDSVDSVGGVAPACAATTPLRMAVASVECCTSGLFYRGFPSVVWLQLPTVIRQPGDDDEEGGRPAAASHRRRGSRLASWLGQPAAAVAQPRREASDVRSYAVDTEESVVDEEDLFAHRQPQATPEAAIVRFEGGDAAGHTGEQAEPTGAGAGEPARPTDWRRSTRQLPGADRHVHRTRTLQRSRQSESLAACNMGCTGVAAGPSRPSRWLMWKPKVPASLQASTSLADWMFVRSPSGFLLEVGGLDAATRESGFEVLLFVHGFNSAVKDVVALLGQMLALGQFPSHIVPVVFAWPCTSGPFYVNCTEVVKSDFIRERFLEALEVLHGEGARCIHLFGHSMGARILANVAEACTQVFPPVGCDRSGSNAGTPANGTPPNSHASTPVATSRAPSRAGSAGGRAPGDGRGWRYGEGVLTLGSVTFLSPDLELSVFVSSVGPAYRSVCKVVTVYGDSHDEALSWSEFGNSIRHWVIRKSLPRELRELSKQMQMRTGTSLGKHCSTIVQPNGEPIDVDFVVTTYLQSNVHNLRHNYFHLNREMVDDIRDVVVNKRRAHLRSHRLQRNADLVYGFLLAPTYVVAA